MSPTESVSSKQFYSQLLRTGVRKEQKRATLKEYKVTPIFEENGNKENHHCLELLDRLLDNYKRVKN